MALVNVSLKLIIKYGMYVNLFAEKKKKRKKKERNVSSFYYTHIFFSAKIPVNKRLYLLEQLTFWPLTNS